MKPSEAHDLSEVFIERSEARLLGAIEPTDFGCAAKVHLGHLFRALSSPTVVLSIDSARFLSLQEDEARNAIDDAFLDYCVDTTDFALILATPTKSFARLAKLIRQTELAHSLAPMPATTVVAAARRANPPDAFRKEILKVTKLSLLNPFQSSSKTPGSMFFGRTKVRKDLIARKGNAWIYGPRRIGKSSLVLQIQRELGRAALPSKKEILRVSYVDLSRLHDPDEQLFVEILRGFDIGPQDTHSYAKVRRLVGRRIGRDPDLDEGSILEELIRLLPKRLVIVLDEVDKWLYEGICERKPMSSLNRLRALCDDERARVFMVGYEHLMAAVKRPEFPFFGRGHEVFLGPTDRENVALLATKPLDELGVPLDPRNEVLQSLWTLSSGRPNIVQDLCAEALVQISDLDPARRVITPAVLAEVARTNEAVERMTNTVRRLNNCPLAQIFAVLALKHQASFTTSHLTDKLPAHVKPRLQDIDMALEILRLRFVFLVSGEPDRWIWANNTVRHGVQTFLKAMGRSVILDAAWREYLEGDWRNAIWEQDAD